MNAKVDATLSAELSVAGSRVERAEVLLRYLERRGGTNYDENVTQLAHGLQCAHLARQAGAAPEAIVAALVHDLGHFLTDEHDADSNFLTEDWYHEILGAECLEPFVVAPVVEAIRLHVLAKRYLCTTDPGYLQGLSPASQRSFQLQGGKLSSAEVAEFEGNPYHALAVRVRRWDDGGKVAGWEVPSLDTYRGEVEACLLAR